VKFIPRRSQILGRIVIKRVLSSIVRPDETRNTTKFVLVDAVGKDVSADIVVGSVVLPVQIQNIVLDGGVRFRPILDDKDVRLIVTDVPLEEFVVQTESAGNFVAFGSADAAVSLGEAQQPSQQIINHVHRDHAAPTGSIA